MWAGGVAAVTYLLHKNDAIATSKWQGSLHFPFSRDRFNIRSPKIRLRIKQPQFIDININQTNKQTQSPQRQVIWTM
jgi:hypothetical protein